MINIYVCMYSLVNNEMNGSKKNEIIEVQNKIDGHKYIVIAKYGVISLVVCISTRLRLIFHADPSNKSYVSIIILITNDLQFLLAIIRLIK